MRPAPSAAWCILLATLRQLTAERAYLCDRIALIENKSLEQHEGLQGVHLHIGSGLYDERFLRWDDATNSWQGLEVDLLDELARRAGFNYTIVILDWSNLTDYDAALQEKKWEVDMVTYAYWYITPQRMVAGAYSPYGFLDSMLYATVVPPEVEWLSYEEIFSFTTPFSPQVWVTFLAMTLGTGLVYLALEGSSNEEDFPTGAEGYMKTGFAMDSMFKSSGHVTGASGFTPQTWAGKILLTSWTWCIVLTLSAYTANLASFLVTKANSDGFSTLLQAVTQQKRIIVEAGTPIKDWFAGTYGDYEDWTSVPLGPQGRGMLLTNGEADTGLFPIFEVEMLRQDADVNPRCSLTTIGEPLQNPQSGWMVTNDVKDNCTVLVRDVLSLWFMRLDLDNTLKELVAKHLFSGGNCPEVAEEEQSSAPTPLEFQNMLGIMSVHAAAVLIALIMHCLAKNAPPPEVAASLTRTLTRAMTASSAKVRRMSDPFANTEGVNLDDPEPLDSAPIEAVSTEATVVKMEPAQPGQLIEEPLDHVVVDQEDSGHPESPPESPPAPEPVETVQPPKE